MLVVVFGRRSVDVIDISRIMDGIRVGSVEGVFYEVDGSLAIEDFAETLGFEDRFEKFTVSLRLGAPLGREAVHTLYY
jgi:hypothetical protein